MKRFLTAVVIVVTATFASAQSLNDECIFATSLGLVPDYCSEVAEFTNTDATMSADAQPGCIFGGGMHDVWFSFTPALGGTYISVSGSIEAPSLAVYEGSCNNLIEVGCASVSDGRFVEVSVTDLKIGQRYYLRVDGRNGNVGDFQICAQSFSPVKKPESDCRDAVVLCDKSPFVVENLNSTGNVQNELTGPCVDGLNGQEAESASVWYVWTCDEPGTLTFTLTPNNPNNDEEDLDFVVYELPGGLDDCDNRLALRCMLSGETAGLNSSPCYGPTGLSEDSNDTQETAGCAAGDDNFVAPLDMEAGKSYGLIVNNFSTSGFGFGIEFGGTGTFLGPEPDFDFDPVIAFECDKTIIFSDLSESLTDEIVSYSWNFGGGSMPSTGTGSDDQEVIYDSFGDKIAALTVETTRGCLVTIAKEFFIDPCCQDTSTLSVEGIPTNLVCFGDEDGQIIGQGFAGNPDYLYSIDGINFQPNPRFPRLTADEYDLFIVDRKGCKDTTVVVITEPTPTIVDAGPDVTVNLGESGMALADITSDYFIDSIYWSPLDSFLDCTDCLDPTILPPGTTTYTITVIDENGCPVSDEVQFLVNIVRPVFWPNIFTPNEDGSNDFFNLFGGPAVSGIEYLKVYDRWGNLMYDGQPELNDRNQGWDGTFNDKLVNPGVYTWIASVTFIDRDDTGDNVSIIYSGDITVYD